AGGEFDRSIGSLVSEPIGSGGAPLTPTGGAANVAGAAGALADAFYLEAEAAQLSGDWQIGSSELASGGEYIESTVDVADPTAPGTGVALYEFTIDTPGDYLVWGRTRGPEPTHSRYFVRIDQGAWIPWRISTGDDFWWDDIHRDAAYGEPLVFLLTSGAHTLEFGNSATGALLDRLYVTGRGDVPPGNDSPCSPPHSIRQGSECIRACGTYGNTACGEVECAGRETMAVYDCAVCCVLD
ncbi:MAG TPA: hypothetical protein VLC09_13155, partial [Polyangiaceae bacterium]|nr:hypothetical protein [Polyangiaceae bacterium]